MHNSKFGESANLLKVLGHAKRLEIACLLHGHDLTVNQMVQMTSLRQAAVSQHLTLLHSAGLIQKSKIGKEVYYSLNTTSFATLSIFIDRLTKTRPLSDNEPTVIDPICLMKLTPSDANCTTEYDGVRHYFCGKGCLKKFNNLHKGAR